ncbi:ATP-dependent nuclease, partial [Corynebacterium coyleae]
VKIKSVEIRNFKAIREFKGEFGKLTTFIGPNGGGKSSILHAIAWLFSGDLKTADDFFCQANGERSTEISVKVTFDSLTAGDRQAFGKYALGEEMTLQRTQRSDSEKTKLWGSPTVFPGFEKFRDANVGTIRSGLTELIESDPNFSNFLGGNVQGVNKKELQHAMDKWEMDPANRHLLQSREEVDATDFFGAVGTGKLAKDAGFVFVPAAPDLTSEFDLSNRKSAMELLVGAVVKNATDGAIAEWSEEHKDVLDDLQARLKDSTDSELSARSEKINNHLSDYLPGAKLSINIGLDDWTPKANPIATTKLSRFGAEWPLPHHGHGVQRATLLAVLQALAELSTEPGGYAPNLIVFVEEPEVYQHPVQARMMASAFRRAASATGIQFVFATHSPYFVDPAFLPFTYRVLPSNTGSSVLRAEEDDYYSKKNKDGELSKYFSKALIEGLFSRACVLVEGDTDKAILELLEDPETGRTLPESGISVIDVEGSETLFTIFSILNSYGVPSYVVRDGDSDVGVAGQKARAKLKTGSNQEFEKKRDQILDSWRNGVEKFVSTAAKTAGDSQIASYVWGSGEYVGDRCAILRHDLEAELENWDQFVEESNHIVKGKNLRQIKKAGIHARIVEACDVSTAPEVLLRIVRAVNQMVDSHQADQG